MVSQEEKLRNLLRLTVEMPQERNPILHEAVARLAKKAGVEMPKLHLFDPQKIQHNPSLTPFRYNALATGSQDRPIMVFGDFLLEHMKKEGHEFAMSPELEAVIGHELGHLKRGLHPLSAEQLSAKMVPLGIVAAVGALAIYRHVQHSNEKKKQFETSLQDDHSIIHQVKHALRPEEYMALVGAQYLAATMLGIGLGAVGFQQMRHVAEFRADRFAAELVSPQAMINALRKTDALPLEVSDLMMKAKLESYKEMGLYDEESIEPMLKLEEFFKKLTHPTTETRITKLEKLQSPGAVVKEVNDVAIVTKSSVKMV